MMKDETYDGKEQTVSEETQAKKVETKIPTTPDKPKHDEATARICVDGLSIMCPNFRKNTVEIAFVKHEHTEVKLNVYDKNCKSIFNPILDQEVATQIEILKTRLVKWAAFTKILKKKTKILNGCPI